MHGGDAPRTPKLRSAPTACTRLQNSPAQGRAACRENRAPPRRAARAPCWRAGKSRLARWREGGGSPPRVELALLPRPFPFFSPFFLAVGVRTRGAPKTSSMRAFSTASRAHNLVFLGAPGVGKGTFANKIAPLLRIPAISTGDIIRAEIKAGSALGAQLKEFTNTGKLVPDEVVSAMVRKRLQEPDAKNGWILVRILCVRGGPPSAAPLHQPLTPPPPSHARRTATRAPCSRQRTSMPPKA